MRAAALVLAVVVLASCAPTTSAAEDDLAKARKFFDDDPDDSRSLTRRVHDYLALDAAVRRKAESEVWELTAHDAHRFENLLRFLHGMQPRLLNHGNTRRELVGGAVVFYDPHPGSGSGGVLGNDSRSFDELFGSSPPIKVPLPKAADLLAFPRDDPKRLHPLGRYDFAHALGETCADDDAGFAELARQFDADPRDPFRCIALGWSRRPEAVLRLTARVRPIAADFAETGKVFESPGIVAAVIRALAHADRAAFDRLIDGFPAPLGDGLLATLGDGSLVRRRLAALDAATTPSQRRLSLCRACDMTCFRLAGGVTSATPRGDDMKRFLRALIEAVESGDVELKADALKAFEWLQYLPASGSEAALHRLAEDVEAGHVVFRRRPSLWEKTVAPTGGEPCKLAGEWTADGLRLRVTNVSDRPIALNAVGLRHATAWRCEADGRGAPNGTFLGLSFPPSTLESYGGPCTTYAAASLVILKPQGVHEIVLPLTKDLRGAEHVRITSMPQIVVGESPAPLAWFASAPIL